MRSSSFWFLLLANLMCSFSNLGWVVLQFPALEAKGFSPSLASGTVAAYGIVSIGARLGLGWIADRIGRARLFTASFLFMGVGLAVFSFAQSFAGLLPYFLFYGLGHAAFVITSQTVVADYFGTHRFATIRGWVGSVSSMGSAAGPLVGAWIFDRSGSYDGAFSLFAAIVVLGAPAALLADRFKLRQSSTHASSRTTDDNAAMRD
jgi:MFS family permease